MNLVHDGGLCSCSRDFSRQGGLNLELLAGERADRQDLLNLV